LCSHNSILTQNKESANPFGLSDSLFFIKLVLQRARSRI